MREENTDLEALRDSLNSDTLKEIVTRDEKTRERFFRAFEYRALQNIAHSVGSSKAAYELLGTGMVFRASICVLKAQEFLNIASGELTHRDGSFLAGKLRDVDPKETGGIGAVKRWGFNRPHMDFVSDQWTRDASSYASKAEFAREMSDLLSREHKVSILPATIADYWLKGKQHPGKAQPDETPE